MVEVVPPPGGGDVDDTRESFGHARPRLLPAFSGRLRLLPRRPAIVYR